METRIEYLKRYLTWLRIQLGKAVTSDTRMEIKTSITRTKGDIKYEEQQILKEKNNGTK